MDSTYTKPINVDELLLSKRLEPLGSEQLAILETIEKYDVSGFSEADVRAYIIDPITRILGYDKGTIFSADLGHALKFLGTNRFPDYQFKLWNANFWLIEAKKPLFEQEAFDYKDLAQAIEYSVHPDVNAALVVLCDGLIIEIFDREVSVDTPVLRVRREELRRDFDKLRLLLEPIQVWFFQKRRIVRMLDKVFDREFNMSRVEEFSDLLERRLRSKSNQIVENFRQTVKPDSDEQRELASTASIEEITELYFFVDFPIPIDNAVNRRLIELSEPNSFWTMLRVFPDSPRVVNDSYMAQALAFLMGLGQKRSQVEWLPAWLAQGSQGNADLESVRKVDY
jgi:hypothetical protein